MSVLRLASARLVAESAACKRASLVAVASEVRAGGGLSVSAVRGALPTAFGSLESSEEWDAAMRAFSLKVRNGRNRTPSLGFQR
jgi:hypothetical protein